MSHEARLAAALVELGFELQRRCEVGTVTVTVANADWPTLHVAGIQVCTADGTDFDIWRDADTPERFGLSKSDVVAYIKDAA